MLSTFSLAIRKGVSLNSSFSVRHGGSISIILLQDVENRGKTGEYVKVKRGYARNFLIPKKLAVYNIAPNREKFAHLIKSVVSSVDEAAIQELLRQPIVLERAATLNGGLFGSVSVADVKAYFEEKQVQVNEVIIENEVIKAVGSFLIKVNGVQVPLEVVPTKEA